MNNLLKKAKIVAVVCNQFGDTGKGKFSDYLSEYWADVCARGTGGNNAGHTVVVRSKEKVFHLLPAGITHDSCGLITILGNGMVIDIESLIYELETLEKEGLSYKNLMISKDAHVIMPFHITRDRTKDQSQKAGGVGSTGRGIGPAYADKIARKGITIGDLFDEEILIKKIKKVKEFYPEQKINENEIVKKIKPFAEKIRPFVKDTISEINILAKAGKKILLEGAQGLLLSVEHGTYPYVTSSDCSLNGTASGVGLSARAIDLTLGIFKFPFMTRVGAGPFPTELGGKESEDYCAQDEGNRKIDELKKTGVRFDENDKKCVYNTKDKKILDLLNSNDEFTQGIGMRLAACEYGSTTGRPRRTGWTDAVAGRYASKINGPFLAVLTKVDSLAGAKEFKICYGYKTPNGVTKNFDKDEKFLKNVKPVYKIYSEYGNIKGTDNYEKLPSSLKQAIEDFEQFIGQKVGVISVGPEREETIIRDV